MIHLYFLVYCISLLSGVVWLMMLFLRRNRGSSKILDGYIFFFLSSTGLIIAMSVIVYLLINVGYSIQLLILISGIVLSISSVMVFALARFTFLKLGKTPNTFEKIMYKLPLLFQPVTITLALTVYDQWVFTAAVIIHLFLVYAVIGYAMILSYRYKCLSKSIRRQELIEGIFCITIAALEFLIHWDFILKTGLFASLPLAYLIINIRLIMKKEQRFSFFSDSSGDINLMENSGLTKKETEIAELVKKGYSNKEIAYELDISPHTVKNHIYNLFQKVNATSRIDLSQKTGQISYP